MNNKRPVAVLECWEEIPCDPCVTACNTGAISMIHLSGLPVLDKDKCTGCGLCAAVCPGLAIFILNYDHDEINGTVTIPYEFLPLPEKGSHVTGTDREGKSVCTVEVTRIISAKIFRKTNLITVLVPKEYIDVVRGIKRMSEVRDSQHRTNNEKLKIEDEHRERIICRCEEITYGEIIDAIESGRTSVKAIKRATRAGMGACQGRTCGKLIMQILVTEGIADWDTLQPDRPRFPLIPVSIESIGLVTMERDK